MSIEIIIALIVFVAGPANSWLTWRLTKNKTVVDEETSYVTGAKVAVDTMMTAIVELQTRVSELTAEAALLRTENKGLREEISLLRQSLSVLSGEVHEYVTE